MKRGMEEECGRIAADRSCGQQAIIRRNYGGATGGYVSFIGLLTDGIRGIVVLTNAASPL